MSSTRCALLQSSNFFHHKKLSSFLYFSSFLLSPSLFFFFFFFLLNNSQLSSGGLHEYRLEEIDAEIFQESQRRSKARWSLISAVVHLRGNEPDNVSLSSRSSSDDCCASTTPLPPPPDEYLPPLQPSRARSSFNKRSSELGGVK